MRVPVVVMGVDEKEKEGIASALKGKFPSVDFPIYDVASVGDAKGFLEKEANATGYVMFNANNEANASQLILRSGKPVYAVAKTIPSSPMYLMDVVAARADGYPIISLATADLGSDAVLEKVRYLVALSQIKSSKVLLITTRSLSNYLSWAFPNSTDVWSIFWSFQQKTGITIELMDAKKFVDEYYVNADEKLAKGWASRWMKGAYAVAESETETEILKAAKLYTAMLKAARDREANVMAFDCIMNFSSGVIDTWPCLGYSQLWYDGVIPVCEADIFSFLPLLIGHYLFGRNGFVNDPGVDELKGEFVNWHCYAPTNPHGSDKPEVPYAITDAHSHTKHVSVHVELPVNETVTVLTYNPVKNFLTLHEEKAIANTTSAEVCATKLVTSGDAKRVARRWRVDSGYHRVILYGDLREPLKEFATLMGIKVIEEDKAEEGTWV